MMNAVSSELMQSVPLYLRLARNIEADILEGRLPVGAQLPSEAAMMSEYGVSRATVRKAVDLVEQKGLVKRRQGVGTLVHRRTLVRPLAFRSLYQDLDRPGAPPPETRVLLFEEVKCTVEVQQWCKDLAIGEPLIHFRRLRLSGDVPVAILENWMRVGDVSFTEHQLEQTSLYQLIADSGSERWAAHQELGARLCNAEEASLLEETEGNPLLTMTRASYDKQNRLLEFGIHAYSAARHVFRQNLVLQEEENLE